MFDTLRGLLAFYGSGSKAVVWEHNSHIGAADATELSARGETNVGQLCRATFGDASYAVGFGTDRGTVAAARRWGSEMRVMHVRPSHPESYESIFHASRLAAGLVPLREPARRALREELLAQRLERAIGVVYRPDTELESHYFYASLARQFDEYVWFDETTAVTPLAAGDHAAFAASRVLQER
jgi:erythromycin esterase-like protein